MAEKKRISIVYIPLAFILFLIVLALLPDSRPSQAPTKEEFAKVMAGLKRRVIELQKQRENLLLSVRKEHPLLICKKRETTDPWLLVQKYRVLDEGVVVSLDGKPEVFPFFSCAVVSKREEKDGLVFFRARIHRLSPDFVKDLKRCEERLSMVFQGPFLLLLEDDVSFFLFCRALVESERYAETSVLKFFCRERECEPIPTDPILDLGPVGRPPRAERPSSPKPVHGNGTPI